MSDNTEAPDDGYGPWALVPMQERSFGQRAKGIIAFNTAQGDLDDKLQAAWVAMVKSAPAPPVRTTPAAQAGDALPPNFVSLYVARSALEAALNSTPERVSVPYAYDQPQSDNDVRMIFRRAARGVA